MGGFVAVLSNVLRDEFFELLIDFVILMMFVHSSHIIQHVLVQNLPQLLILNVELPQKKLYRRYWVQYVLRPQYHNRRYAFLSIVRMQTLTQLVHEAHCCRWNEAQWFREEAHTLCQEYQQLSEALVFSHGLALDFIELDFEELFVIEYVLFVEDVVSGHFDGDLLEFFEKGVIGRLFVFLLHVKLKIL